ncbi:MAG: hypothetical protein B6D62_00790 [Candidatus Cloacimonas sp. 4484_275]|nr:MAG: hypothetical protein B6D62_00790 [Candidatus Cloacimonas sp. 4484_275]
MKIFLSVLLLLTISFASEALEVFGKVYGNNQLPLENVVVSSEKKAAISNAKGYFNLQNIEANEKIRFHKIGFKDTVFVAKQLPRKVILEEKSIEIAGINIVGKRENRGTCFRDGKYGGERCRYFEKQRKSEFERFKAAVRLSVPVQSAVW